MRASRRLFDGVWNAGGDGERCGHTDVMYGSLTRSPAVSARHKYQMAGTSRILEGLMARRGLVEPVGGELVYPLPAVLSRAMPP